MDKILTLEEVAALLRVSERTVVDWALKGELPGGKIGTTWRFRESEINEWLNMKLRPRIRKDVSTYNSLSILLFKERIRILDAGNKSEALNQLIDILLEPSSVPNRSELANAIFAREGIMSTGIGLGIAVPHCRLNTVKDIHVAVGINRIPLTDYESLDGLPVRILIMIVAGRNQHTEYVRVLSLFSSLLKDEGTRLRLLAALSADAVYDILVGGTDE